MKETTMKVCCVRLTGAYGSSQEQSPWLTIGKTYHVLSVEFGSDRKWRLRLIGDGLNGVALFPLEEFETLSSKIPGNWVVSWGTGGFFELTPASWSGSGFWERYYDGDPLAVDVFEREKTKIIEADP
jgi:hypothetical protein